MSSIRAEAISVSPSQIGETRAMIGSLSVGLVKKPYLRNQHPDVNRSDHRLTPRVTGIYGVGPEIPPRVKEFLEENPLPYVPSPEARREKIDFNTLHTAAHEVNHWLVAEEVGARVLGISVKPEGNSLGRTFIEGQLLPGHFDIVAAAGAVDTPFGSASGFSHDMLQIGASQQSALKEAKSVLEKTDRKNPGFRAKITEIIAYLEVVPGSLLPDIKRRAELELFCEENRISDSIYKRLDGKKMPMQPETKEFKLPDAYTLIETFEEGEIRIASFAGNILVEESFYCICGGKDGNHAPDCPFISSLPRSGVIFTLN